MEKNQNPEKDKNKKEIDPNNPTAKQDKERGQTGVTDNTKTNHDKRKTEEQKSETKKEETPQAENKSQDTTSGSE